MRKFARPMIVLSHEGDDSSSASVVEIKNGNNTVTVSNLESALHMLPAGSEVDVVAKGTVGNTIVHKISRAIREGEIFVSLDLSGATELSKVFDSPFRDNFNLIGLRFPSNLSSISYMALAGCKNLKHVSIPATVQEIGEKAFSGCEKLVHLEFADPDGWQIEKDGGEVEAITNLTNAEDNPYRFTLPSSPYRKCSLQKNQMSNPSM